MNRTRSPIDWQEASRGVPSEDWLADVDLGDPADLEEALDNFIAFLESQWFLSWEAVLRDEQGLPLSKQHADALSRLVGFGDEEDDDILYIDELPRPSGPWYKTARTLARALLLREFRASESHNEVVFRGWDQLRRALETHTQGLSLPPTVGSPQNVIPSDISHRLDLQSCFWPFYEMTSSLDRRSCVERVHDFIETLRDRPACAHFLGLTANKLFEFLTVPDDIRPLLQQAIQEELQLSGPNALLTSAL